MNREQIEAICRVRDGYGLFPDQARELVAELDALRAENERLQRERDEALAREKANFGRYIEASRKAEQARAKALDEAAAVAEEWESGESAAFYIRELKAKDPK